MFGSLRFLARAGAAQVASKLPRLCAQTRNYALPAHMAGAFAPVNPKHILHCTFTRNNTILTLSRRVSKKAQANIEPGVIDQEALIDVVRPHQEVIVTVTTGQLGFRGTVKSSYDAAFQTTAKMFSIMESKGLLNDDIELVTRNFGQNREAFFKVLFGKEGTKIRPLVKRISDGTKIKFGGDRSPNRRRV